MSALKQTSAIILILLALLNDAWSAAPDEQQLRASAEVGSAQAQFELGARYEYGNGVPRSLAEALLWYRLAAKQGSAIARYNLGILYGMQGRPDATNYVQAYMWYELAAACSGGLDPVAVTKHRDEMSANLTSEQRAQSLELLMAFQQEPGFQQCDTSTPSTAVASKSCEIPKVGAANDTLLGLLRRSDINKGEYETTG